MGNEDLLKQVTAKAQIWLGDGYDEETKAAVRAMLDNEDKTDLIEAFYKDLEFVRVVCVELWEPERIV